MDNQAPFLDVKSFISEEVPASQDVLETSVPPSSPFLSLYEVEEGFGPIDPETEEYTAFLSELYDEEFDEALFELAGEAAALYETQFMYEQADARAIDSEAEQLLTQHFAPLIREAETMIGNLASELSQRDPGSLTEGEIEALVDRYQPDSELSPSFENFFGKFKKALKKIAKKGLKLAKKGISAAAKLGLGPILNKLKALVKPLLKRVLNTAISKLPRNVQPIARKLAERLPFLKELEESYILVPETAAASNITEIQQEFNYQVANLLFAPGTVEQELEVAQIMTEAQTPVDHSLAELDHARIQFIDSLVRLKEGEDPIPYVENFLPAILPALRLGIKLAGRKRVVYFLAKFLSRLIRKFIGPQAAPTLSKAIVDAGLRLINLEATSEDEARAAGSAVAATVEETVRRVAALPDYVLDNQELLEGYTLEAFEKAVAANLPPVLPKDIYRKRPHLSEAKSVRGVWIPMPLRGRRKKYKKFSRVLRAKISPYKTFSVETFGGEPLSEFLEEQLGLLPGEEVEANVHLYECSPGTMLSELTRLEQNTPGLGALEGYQLLHPLTSEAANALVGEPGLGRKISLDYLSNPYATDVGQRLYYLEVPGKRPLMTTDPGGRRKMRRRTGVRLTLDFRNNQIRIFLYLSEIRAQQLAVKLRQQAHVGMITTQMGRLIEHGMQKALRGGFGRLKIIHEAVTPDQWLGAIQRLPSLVTRILLSRLNEWVIKGLSDNLKQHVQQFIAATEEPADGITLKFTVDNPPGFAQLRQALKGRMPALESLKLSEGIPAVSIRIAAGYDYE